jgi:hypothetical protein
VLPKKPVGDAFDAGTKDLKKNPRQEWLSACDGPSYPSLSGAFGHVSTACPRGQNPPSRKRDGFDPQHRIERPNTCAVNAARENDCGRETPKGGTHLRAGKTLRRVNPRSVGEAKPCPGCDSPQCVPDTAHRPVKTSATNDTQRTVIRWIRNNPKTDRRIAEARKPRGRRPLVDVGPPMVKRRGGIVSSVAARTAQRRPENAVGSKTS